MNLKCDRHLYLIIGCYGAGKTTHLSNHPDCMWLDFEACLDPLVGYRRKYYPAARRVAKAMYWSGFHAALLTGVNLAVTTDGPTVHDRAEFIIPARAAGYRIIIEYLPRLMMECQQRCRADRRRPKTTDWEPMIRRWFDRFEPIGPEEGDEYREC